MMMSGQGCASVWVERRLDAVTRVTGTTTFCTTVDGDDPSQQLVWSLSEAEGSALSVHTPLPDHHDAATIRNYAGDKNRVSPTSILDFPPDFVVEQGVEVIQDGLASLPEKKDADLWKLQQPDFLRTVNHELMEERSTDTREGGTTSTARKETGDRSTSADIRQISSSTRTSSIFTRSRSPSLATYYYRGKALCPTESFESDDDESSSPSQGETESFDPFALAEDEGLEEDSLLFDNSDNALENNVLWTYISNIDGSASAHPRIAPPVDDDDDLFATAVKSPVVAATPKHSRRVSFDDMMQVRYFCRSQEERVAMKNFSAIMKSQIRRRRRRSKLNLSDSSDECADRAIGWTMATKASSQRDDDSISGIFADVVDEISDMITEVVIDAKRQHKRAFFRDIEPEGPTGRTGPSSAPLISQGFLGSLGCIPTIKDYETTNATPSPISADESATSSTAPATTTPNNLLQTWQSTASSRVTDEHALLEVEDDDEPWFCKAMRCGSKCGN